MREIKFRCWNKQQEKMFSWEELLIAKSEFVFEWINANKEFKFNISEQFTGLHDKNGKEIYEGDIVHGSYGIPPRGVTSVVEYNGSAFIIKTKGHNPEEVTLRTGIECLDLYVEGNIHENPELILGD